MPRLGFETTIPTFKRGKTVHALDRAATVIDLKRRRFINTQYLYEGAEKNRKKVVKIVYRIDLNTGHPNYETGVVVIPLA
jgi:hypothetical protein